MARTQQQRFLAAAQVQYAVGEDMATLEVAGQLDLVDGNEGGLGLAGMASTVQTEKRALGGAIFSSPVMFWLTFGGCGGAVLSAAFPELGIGFLGCRFAFGLTVLTMAYAVGHISGGHFNPAVTLGLVVGRTLRQRHVVPYIVAQVIGAIVGAAVCST